MAANLEDFSLEQERKRGDFDARSLQGPFPRRRNQNHHHLLHVRIDLRLPLSLDPPSPSMGFKTKDGVDLV